MAGREQAAIICSSGQEVQTGKKEAKLTLYVKGEVHFQSGPLGGQLRKPPVGKLGQRSPRSLAGDRAMQSGGGVDWLANIVPIFQWSVCYM